MAQHQQPPRGPRILSSAERRQRVIPLSFQLTGVALNFISMIHNEWASRVLARLWFTVFKSPPKPWVAEFRQQADEQIWLSVEETTIPIYSWGQGPLVVLMHGWSGSGTQYRYFIPQLVNAGFRVICFDAPEHGSNPDRQTHMLRFGVSLIAIQTLLGEMECVVTYSLGAMATTLAMQRGHIQSNHDIASRITGQRTPAKIPADNYRRPISCTMKHCDRLICNRWHLILKAVSDLIEIDWPLSPTLAIRGARKTPAK